jgi:hypothetical protein
MTARWTRLGRHLRTSKWKCIFELKRFSDVCGKCLAKIVYLFMHLRHWPRGSNCLQNAHMPDKELSGIVVQFWVRTSDCNLFVSNDGQQYIGRTYQVKHGTSQDRIHREAQTPDHAQQARQTVCFQDGFLKFAHVFGSCITGHHMLFPDAVTRVRDCMKLRA